MKFNFKKIATVFASAVMLGSTLGFAAAANYPAPFVAGGSADVAVIVGDLAATSDYLAAANVGSALATELASQTATGGSTTTSVSGEAVVLSTGNTKLYFNDTINKATSKATLSKTELPVLLKDGTLVDDAGTSYDYSQKIIVNTKYIAYGTSGSDIDDPTLYVDLGAAQASPVYNMSITFEKDVNITSGDVRGNTITMFGQDYTIGAGSDAAAGTPILYLYGAGDTVTLNEGETTTATVAGTEYTVEIVGISSSEAVSLRVDGGTVKEIAEGASSKAGDLNIYVKSAFYSAKEASSNYAELSLGSEKITLTDLQNIKTGTDDTSIYESHVDLETSGGKLSKIVMSVAATDSTLDSAEIGDSFTDTVFGTFKLEYGGSKDDLKSDDRDHIMVDTDNSENAKVTFTSDLTGTEYTLNYAHDGDGVTTTARPNLADTSNKTIHVLENETVYKNEYMVVNSGDDGRILKLTGISMASGGSTTDKVTFKDVISGEDHSATGNFTAGPRTLTIGGEDYTIHANKTEAHVKWNSGATLAIFPRIKLANGGWIAFLKDTNLSIGTYIFPSGYSTVTSETLTFGGVANISKGASLTYSDWNWTREVIENYSFHLTGLDIENDGDVDCNFSYMKGPTILFMEEKKDGDTYGDAICVPLTTTGTTELAIDTPLFGDLDGRGASRLVTWTSDTYTSSAMDAYGTYVEKNTATGTNQKVDIYYPDEQMEMNIIIGASDAGITSSTSASDVTELGTPVYSDSEITQVQGRNLIVVGGSCINKVAANLLTGSTAALCGADFTTETTVSSGQYIIKVVESPYSSDKIAMLVAGYEAADTLSATNYLTTEKPASDVGTEIIA